MVCSRGAARARSSASCWPAPSFADFKERAEKAFIEHKLRENDWNITETARSVGMPRSNLYKKINKYGLERGSREAGGGTAPASARSALDR